MKDIGKVKLTMQPQKKSLQKVWEWLEKYVAPSLKLFAEVGKNRTKPTKAKTETQVQPSLFDFGLYIITGLQ